MSWRTWFLQIVPEWRPQCEGQSQQTTAVDVVFQHKKWMCFFPTSQLQDLVVSSFSVFAPHNWFLFLSCSLQVFIPNIEIETCFFQLWRGSSLYLFSINCRERERERVTWLTRVATGIRPCSTSHKWLWRFFRNRCLNLSLHQQHQHTSNTHQYLLYWIKVQWWKSLWQKTWQVLHGLWMYKLYLKRPSCALK